MQNLSQLGVGDTEQDIEFLSHCTVRVMMSGRHHDYLTIAQLQPVIDLVYKVQSTANAKLEVRHLLKDDMLRARCEDILHGAADFDRAINHATQVLEDWIRRKVEASGPNLWRELS